MSGEFVRPPMPVLARVGAHPLHTIDDLAKQCSWPISQLREELQKANVQFYDDRRVLGGPELADVLSKRRAELEREREEAEIHKVAKSVDTAVKKLRELMKYEKEVLAEFKDDPAFPLQLFRNLIGQKKNQIMLGKVDDDDD